MTIRSIGCERSAWCSAAQSETSISSSSESRTARSRPSEADGSRAATCTNANAGGEGGWRNNGVHKRRKTDVVARRAPCRPSNAAANHTGACGRSHTRGSPCRVVPSPCSHLPSARSPLERARTSPRRRRRHSGRSSRPPSARILALADTPKARAGADRRRDTRSHVGPRAPLIARRARASGTATPSPRPEQGAGERDRPCDSRRVAE